MDTNRPPKWEYKAFEPPKGLTKREAIDPTAELNDLGVEGWELTATVDYDKDGTKLLVLKRSVYDE